MILHLHIFHLLQTTSIPHRRPRCRRARARLARRSVSRAHLLGRALHFSAAQFPHARDHARASALSLSALDRRRARPRARPVIAARCFPWQSGSNGREESQIVHLNPRSGRWIPDETHLQRHVNAAIAYNIWQYFEVTRDSEFLQFVGVGDVSRDREVLGQPGDLQRNPRALRNPRRRRAGRVSHPSPRPRGAGAG